MTIVPAGGKRFKVANGSVFSLFQRPPASELSSGFPCMDVASRKRKQLVALDRSTEKLTGPFTYT
jgi:hypothetical protein